VYFFYGYLVHQGSVFPKHYLIKVYIGVQFTKVSAKKYVLRWINRPWSDCSALWRVGHCWFGN